MSKTASVVPLQPSLFFPQPSQLSVPPAASRSQLWACLFFPQLSLEVLRAEVDAVPWAVVHDLHGKQMVYAASQPARQLGVAAGMALPAAYALCPELETAWRDESAEQTSLMRLADWAGQYSAMVSLEPQALLLEIGASLKLFGGLQTMQARMQKALQRHPNAVDIAIAPTPQAALLLARCGVSARVNETAALRAILGNLTVSVLPATDKQAALLTRLGLRKLRDLWRLPKTGLTKRFGVAFSDYLDRLLGNRPEPRLPHRTTPIFSAHWPFPIETENMTFILYGVKQLLPRLVRFMRLRELTLNRLQIIFYHADKAASQVTLGTRQLCCDETHLLCLLRERLNQKKLSAPVLELTLVASEFHSFIAHHQSLLAHDDEQGPEWQQVLDQLQTRLGEQAVNSLQLLDEHRPEYAWAYGPAVQTVERPEPGLKRPLWLVPQPQRLRDGLHGIELVSEKERIAGGWWDGLDIRRDYYRARDSRGRNLWLFCDLKNGQWYIHGLFA